MVNKVTVFSLVGVVLIFALGFTLLVWDFSVPKQKVTQPPTDNHSQLSALASLGKKAFDDSCATCHGPAGVGTNQGPPLVHDIYNPGHHSDEAFYRAAQSGTPQHHWAFGDMPPQSQVSREEVRAIIRYIRELQEASGIFYRPHRM